MALLKYYRILKLSRQLHVNVCHYTRFLTTCRAPQLQDTMLQTHTNNLSFYRIKSKSNKKNQQQSIESDDEENEEEPTKDFESLVVDNNSKIITTKVNSTRVDVILQSALSIARNKVEEMFYESKIRVNGKDIKKKQFS